MASETQTIPARHGVATFVPAGQTIKIINTSGTQVVDTWAFALPKPEAKEDHEAEEKPSEARGDNETEATRSPQSRQKKTSKRNSDFPSQEEAEKSTKNQLEKAEKEEEQRPQNSQKSTWGSYVPSLGTWTAASKKTTAAKQPDKENDGETEQQKNSKTWASYFPSGKGVSSYIPKQASDTVSAFAASHNRDTSKSYLGQLRDFSKTPVGAAGLAVMSGSGYGGSLYAGYQAWNAQHAANVPQMEFLSMTHTRVATMHLRPRVDDTLVTNIREPILTLLEDTTGGVHDTLIAACDPMRYRALEVENWEEHGSCAENLVLALKELNEQAGLKGAKGVGADITVNNVPAPLNLFMNTPWDDDGALRIDAPQSRKGGFVRFRAERDVVMVMSACPQDVVDTNAKTLSDAHFIVEEEETAQKLKRTQAPAKKASLQASKRQPAPRKFSLSQTTQKNNTAAKTAAVPAAARKKPIPPQIKPQGSPVSTTGGKATSRITKGIGSTNTTTSGAAQNSTPSTPSNGKANGDQPAQVEKRKPRKLASRSKAASG